MPCAALCHHILHLSIEHSLKWHCKLLCVTLYVYCPNTLHANTYCNELLVWFKVPGFWGTINTALSLRFISNNLLLPRSRMIGWLGSTSRGRVQWTTGCCTSPCPQVPNTLQVDAHGHHACSLSWAAAAAAPCWVGPVGSLAPLA